MHSCISKRVPSRWKHAVLRSWPLPTAVLNLCLRYMMVLSRSFWVRHPWHAECAIVCKRVFAVQGKLHPAAEMRQIVGLEKPAYQTHRNDTAGRGGRKMPRLRSPSCRFEVGVSETVANWALKQLCWTWVTEGFWRFQLTDCTRNGTFEEANPFHFLGVSEVTGAIWRDAAQRSFRRDSRLLRDIAWFIKMGNDGKHTYLIIFPPQFSEWKWLECYGLFPVVRFGCIAQDLGQHVRFANSQERRVARKAASEEDHSSSRCLKGIALQVSHHIYIYINIYIYIHIYIYIYIAIAAIAYSNSHSMP